MKVLSIVIMSALMVLNGWQFMQGQKREQQLQHLSVQVKELEAELMLAEQQLADLESDRIENQVKQTGDELLQGWQSFVQRLSVGIDAAKKALENDAPATLPAPDSDANSAEQSTEPLTRT